MTKSEVLERFNGPSETARILTQHGWAISSVAITQWNQVPMGRQFQIQVLTKGRLRVGGGV